MVLKLEGVAIGILMVGLIMIGFTGALNDLSNNYGFEADTQFVKTFNKLNETQVLAETVAENVKGSNFDSIGGVFAIPKSGIGAMKLVMNGVGTFAAMIEEVAQIFGIPAWVISASIAIFLIMVAFSLLAYWGYKK